MAEKKRMPDYQVIRDTREQKGWHFPVSPPCLGTVVGTLKTGDYTLKGYEDQFVIERKGSIAEFVENVVQQRFERELQRLEAFPHAFVVLEFTFDDIVNWPLTAAIPERAKQATRLTPQFIMKRFNEFQIMYKTKFILAGEYGLYVASSLFKRVVERVSR